MKASIQYAERTYEIDLTKPLDISITLKGDGSNAVAWYMDQPLITPVVMGDFVGSIKQGNSSTNFNLIQFSPHAHGTHTECLGHITRDFYSVNQSLDQFFFLAQVVSILPQQLDNGDSVITVEQIQQIYRSQGQKAFIIRTLPNVETKKSTNYSHTNPYYLHWQAAAFLADCGIEHLLVDLPSVDREKDQGKLLAHKAFWRVKHSDNIGEDARLGATITELIFVDDVIEDDFYFLNLQIAPFDNDASPSKPILYQILK